MCSLPGTVENDWHLPFNTRIGRLPTVALCFLQVQPEHVINLKGSGDAVENVMPPASVILIQHDWFSGGSVMVWDNSTLTATVLGISSGGTK